MNVSRLRVLVPVAIAVALAASAIANAASVAIHVQSHLAVTKTVHVSFRAQPLSGGGYYYGVIVLRPYKRYTRSSPPPCATSSNMQRTDYGYPRSGAVALALTPTRSATGRWCRGGSYEGAIYAVPHTPPCEGKYPCRAEPYEPPSPCWSADGHIVCGVVALPRQYRYPDGPPSPLASGTRLVARFTVKFPG